MASDPFIVIAGLGNPGPSYARNRHNIGFMFADHLARLCSCDPTFSGRQKFQSYIQEVCIDAYRVLVMKPQRYMNESGIPVANVLKFYKIPASRLYVVHDDLDLQPGKVRIKTGGGHGGHNGLRSIDSHIGPSYTRLRLGIGHPGHKDRVTPHVLGDFSRQDQVWIQPLLDALVQNLPILLSGQSQAYQTKVFMHLPQAAQDAMIQARTILAGERKG